MKKLVLFLIMFSFSVSCFAKEVLNVYSGAGLMKPMNELSKSFEEKYNRKISIHYGGSGELFGLIAAGQPCDVFIPGAEKYTFDALKNGWVVKSSIKKIVYHIPVIAVPKGNPAHIKSLSDLMRKGVKVAICDPKSAAIGKTAVKILKKNKIYGQLKDENIKVYAPTVNQLLIYVVLRQVDAAVIWQDLTKWANSRGKIEAISIPEKDNIVKTIPAAVMTASKNKNLSKQFVGYITSKKGMIVWKKWGFEPVK